MRSLLLVPLLAMLGCCTQREDVLVRKQNTAPAHTKTRSYPLWDGANNTPVKKIVDPELPFQVTLDWRRSNVPNRQRGESWMISALTFHGDRVTHRFARPWLDKIHLNPSDTDLMIRPTSRVGSYLITIEREPWSLVLDDEGVDLVVP